MPTYVTNVCGEGFVVWHDTKRNRWGLVDSVTNEIVFDAATLQSIVDHITEHARYLIRESIEKQIIKGGL